MRGLQKFSSCGQQAGRFHAPAILGGTLAAACFWSTALVEILSVLLLLAAFSTLRKDSLRANLLPLSVWAILVAGIILSAFLSPLSTGTGYALKLWHAALFPAGLLMERTRRENILLLTMFTLSGAIASLAALGLHATSGSAYAMPVVSGLTTYASLLALAGPAALYLLLHEPNPGQGVLAARGAVVLLIFAGVFFSARAVPILVITAGSAIVVYSFRPRALIALAVGLAALLLISPQATTFKLAWLLSGGEADRYMLWNAAIRLLAERPLLGFGPMSFHAVLPDAVQNSLQFDSATSWHSDFLAVTLESGWPVGFVFTAGLLSGLVVSLRTFIDAPGPAQRLSAALRFALLLGAAMIAATTTVVFSAVLGAAWWLLIGLCLGTPALPSADRRTF